MKILMLVMAITLCYAGLAKVPPKTAVICGVLPEGKEDIITINVIAEKLTGFETFERKKYKIRSENGRFYFKIDVPVNLSYVTISFNKPELMKFRVNNYLVGYDDSVVIKMENDSVLFSGKGSAKWKCMYELSKNNSLSWADFTGDISRLSSFAYLKIVLSKFDDLLSKRLHIVEAWKSRLSKNDYRFIKNEILAENELAKYRSFSHRFNNEPDSTTTACYVLLSKLLSTGSPGLNGEKMVRSHTVTELNILKSRLTAKLKYREMPAQEIFSKTADFIRNQFKGVARDKFITEYILYYSRFFVDPTNEIRSALRYVTTKRYRTVLKELLERKTPGMPAYNFSLEDGEGKMVSYKDFKGKAMVTTFWITGCPACMELEKAMKEVRNQYKADTNIVFMHVGMDTKKEQWIQSLQSGIYSEPANINVYAEPGINPLLRYYKISSSPTVIITGKNGKIIMINPERPISPGGRTVFNNYMQMALK